MEKNNPLGVRKGLWTPEEDILLKKCIENYGEGKWHLVPFRAGLNRCRKSCRLRWLNYLKPNIKRGQFTKDEVDLIIRLHKLLGNRWSLIGGRLPGRTANDVKNFWNTHMEKKVLTVGEEAIAGRVNAQKPVAVRPQPRTFKIGSSHDSEIDNQPSSSSDECTRWWTNLLQMSTDLDHHSCTTTDSDTLGGEGLVDAPDHNHNLPPAAEDLDDFTIGVDIWELLSLQEES